MLRHAEMPNGSRQVPTVYDGFILGPPHGSVGRLLIFHSLPVLLHLVRYQIHFSRHLTN